MKRTTTKEFKAQVQQHILDALGTDETTDVTEQLQAVQRDFKAFYDPNTKKQTPNLQDAFMSFLQGLPSSLDAEFTHFNIHETMKEWHTNVGNTYSPDNIGTEDEQKQYYWLVYREFLVLLKKHNLTFPI